MTDPVKLYNEFLQVAKKGDEAAARKFLSDHLADFPQDTQDELIFAFIEEALLKRAEAIKENAAVQQEGIQAIEELQKAKKDLENDARVDELKGQVEQK